MAFLRKIIFSTCLFLPFFLISSEKVTPTSAQVFFSPTDHVCERLVSLIEEETSSIKVAIYCLTHHKIAQALVAAKNRGVSVEMIVDPFSIKTRAPLKKLSSSGIPIFVWDPNGQSSLTPSSKEKKFRRSLMHDKFCIFGDKIVWTGSFNFTYDASNAHQENVVVLEDSTIAQCYIEEFNLMKTRGCRRYEDFISAKPQKKRVKK